MLDTVWPYLTRKVLSFPIALSVCLNLNAFVSLAEGLKGSDSRIKLHKMHQLSGLYPLFNLGDQFDWRCILTLISILKYLCTHWTVYAFFEKPVRSRVRHMTLQGES